MIHVDLLRYGEGLEITASKFDTDEDFENWKSVRTEILSIAFLGRSFFVASESPSKQSWLVSDHIESEGHSFLKICIDGKRFILANVISATRDLLFEIGTEQSFRLATLWLILADINDLGIVNEIYDLRKEFPTNSSMWYSCKTEFLLCENDGACIIWNRPQIECVNLREIIVAYCAGMKFEIAINTTEM